MELHLLSAHLPETVRRMVGGDAAAMADAIAEENTEARQAASDYFLHIIRLVVVEPDFGSVETIEELDSILMPADFQFLIEISQRERDTDALGRQLWGAEPLARWEPFRQFHRCAPDCAACDALQRGVPVADFLKG